jgi:hypothetical protein
MSQSQKRKKRVPKFLQAMRNRLQPMPGVSAHLTRETDLNLHKEVGHIIECATACDSHVVGIGGLVLFSTETGDAWMLDPLDELALCLMKNGDPQSFNIGETDRKFAVEWTGRYHIEGSHFAYVPYDTPTHARVIDGYPTDVIRRTIETLRANS